MKQLHLVVALGLVTMLAPQEAAHGGTAGRVDMETLHTPLYTPEGDAFVRHNGDRFNNRPLYCNQTERDCRRRGPAIDPIRQRLGA